MAARLKNTLDALSDQSCQFVPIRGNEAPRHFVVAVTSYGHCDLEKLTFSLRNRRLLVRAQWGVLSLLAAIS
jgi:hypothetical protein